MTLPFSFSLIMNCLHPMTNEYRYVVEYFKAEKLLEGDH